MEFNLQQRESFFSSLQHKISSPMCMEIYFKSKEWQQYEADHSAACSYGYNNVWSFTSSPPEVFTGWHLNKEKILQVDINLCEHKKKNKLGGEQIKYF